MEPVNAITQTTILFVDHTASLGGGEIALLNLIESLDTSRFRPIVVLGSDGPFAQKLRALNIQTIIEYLDSRVLDTRKDNLSLKTLTRIRDIWVCFQYSIRLAAIAKRVGAKVIHTNSLKSDLFGGIAGLMVGIPVIWHVRDNITDKYLPRSVASIFRLLCRVIPKCVIVNSKSTLYALEHGDASVNSLGAATISDINPITHDQAVTKYQVVYCGCSTEQFKPSLSKKNETTKVLLVGRITEWKGQHIFIHAAKEVLSSFPQVKFQIAGAPLFGEVEYEQRLHQIVQSLHIEDKVEFLGFRNDIPALLSEADIVVHASTIGEPFGQVVVEGMAAGKPVIATNGGAIPELIQDGESGLLVPMSDSSAMAHAILSLLSNPELANRIGTAARARALNLFAVSRTARRVEAVYDHVLLRRLDERQVSIVPAN